MQLQVLCEKLLEHPSLGVEASFADVRSFIQLATLAKAAITFQLFDISHPPQRLPLNVHAFLTAALDRPWAIVQHCWEVFAEVIWSSATPVAASAQDWEIFRRFGLPQGIAHMWQFPCHERHVNAVPTGSARRNVVYEGGRGSAHFQPFYILQCLTRYHPNFSVNKQASTYTYYKGVPDVLQVSQRSYFETALLEVQASQMTFAWVSSANCARMYNQGLRERDTHNANSGSIGTYTPPAQAPPPSWGSSLTMSGENVLDGFYLHSLLLDKAEHHVTLVQPHDAASQKLRLEPAMAERNAAMEGFGQ
ncbi:hypothetical protein K439DRAFT_1614172 [Ramaria rubella]|nr:hypothetical protein K439DRAFT_1614172 [Ramaria rubella]